MKRSAIRVFIVMSSASYLRVEKGAVHLTVKVVPRASKNEILPAQGDALRVRITAPPVDSAANEALREFLAETLGCHKRDVELLRGQTSRHKLLRVHNVPGEVVQQRIEAFLSST